MIRGEFGPGYQHVEKYSRRKSPQKYIPGLLKNRIQNFGGPDKFLIGSSEHNHNHFLPPTSGSLTQLKKKEILENNKKCFREREEVPTLLSKLAFVVTSSILICLAFKSIKTMSYPS